MDSSVGAAGREHGRRSRIETVSVERRTRRPWDTRRASRSVTRGATPADHATVSMPTIILLATSGTPAARNATVVAAQLAKRLGAQLTIVHVVPPIEYRVGRLTPTLTITGRLADPKRNRVLSDALLIAASSGIAAHTALFAGSPSEAIVALAQQLGANLLVVGARPRRGLARPTGRIERRVQALAPCPVLAVPLDDPRPARVFDRRARIGAPLLRMLARVRGNHPYRPTFTHRST